jgi:DNA-binding beta-propeller fold protein YncE
MFSRLTVGLTLVCAMNAQVLYVASLSTNNATTITVLNAATGARLAQTPLRAGGLAATADGRTYFATDANGSSVAAYTGASVQLLTTGATGGSPVAVAVAPNGARIYVAAAGGGNITVHDARTLVLIRSVTAGFSPTAIAVHPDNSRFYVANSSNREIAVFDAADFRLLKRLRTGGGPVALAFLNDRTLLALDSGAESVVRIDTREDTIEGSYLAGPEPVAMAIATNGRILISNASDSKLRVFNGATGQALNTINLPPCRWGRCSVMSLATDGDTVYAADSNQQEVFAANITSGEIKSIYPVPPGPRWLAVAPAPPTN